MIRRELVVYSTRYGRRHLNSFPTHIKIPTSISWRNGWVSCRFYKWNGVSGNNHILHDRLLALCPSVHLSSLNTTEEKGSKVQNSNLEVVAWSTGCGIFFLEQTRTKKWHGFVFHLLAKGEYQHMISGSRHKSKVTDDNREYGMLPHFLVTLYLSFSVHNCQMHSHTIYTVHSPVFLWSVSCWSSDQSPYHPTEMSKCHSTETTENGSVC